MRNGFCLLEVWPTRIACTLSRPPCMQFSNHSLDSALVSDNFT
jgi:hypothetical protein